MAPRRIRCTREVQLDGVTLRRAAGGAITVRQGDVVVMHDLGELPQVVLNAIPHREDPTATATLYLRALPAEPAPEAAPKAKPRKAFKPPPPEPVPVAQAAHTLSDPTAPAIAPPLPEARPKRKYPTTPRKRKGA